ncbi:MAG: hypothetical protein A3H72_01610 [Candidatus Doudnabacteria bacterium RIFCSPLOWO2_02_FULL_48_8]|uniref:Pilus assembly protein PilO n=1 Tax=Candidatus Doudnabacteria bacterium RIFCSPHIGHO2_01_FULL_46_24 TaxID=1817825 RepID=A0A1F5NTM1_9BACT|nr:MAG: hypothetical protein A2720_03880 [Candidatus Doudnabacteria bacterium RIFCSPHIGHO2_01_FULL_46_24]OGE94982.1 MAG: hypothetical protein A3H72_01610 [Candidatus Doudnabacteria bacterium RIFCSPLOWO2_02_FULL_48_8]OGE95882.1 MAG: hypothetical protein A3E98_03890 [Candidatus Doudnabacteria bacterium RIFCSPHIGHO2_12_FULL_48_11]
MSAILKLTVIFLGGLLATGLLFGLLVNPMLGRLGALNLEVSSKHQQLATLERQIEAYNNAQTDLSKASRKDEILTAFVDREELVLAVKNLELAAAKTGTEEELDIEEEEVDVKPKDQKPPVVANKPGLDEIRYRLTLLNDFAGIVEFIKYMEHLPQFTEIAKIDLSAELVDSEDTKAKIYTGRVFTSIDGVFFVNQKAE